mgnify:CR=1 FL=1
MANGQQLGEQNVDAFKAWIATQSDEDFKQMIYGGKLNRNTLSKLAQVGLGAFKKNPEVKRLLLELEDKLRERGVLPPLTDQGKKAQEGKAQAYDHTKNKSIMESKRLSKIETENIELKAELAELKNTILRFKELSKVLDEVGLFPQ